MDTVSNLADAAWRLFYNDPLRGTNGRYRSWEHCYKVFHDARLKRQKGETLDYDYLSLHLAFYLASWGMYRGSSFLLQHDYKVHEGAAIEIMKDKYDSLQGVTCKKVGGNLDLLFELAKKLKVHYEGIRIKTSGHKRTELSATLITKILMGTLGCVPAYDRYFVDGIKKKAFNIKPACFSQKSIQALANFYVENEKTFEETRAKLRIHESGVMYPQMKFLDMGFWQMGKIEDDNKREQKETHE